MRKKRGDYSQENAWISRNATQSRPLNQAIPKATPLHVHFVICTNYWPISKLTVVQRAERNDAFLSSRSLIQLG